MKPRKRGENTIEWKTLVDEQEGRKDKKGRKLKGRKSNKIQSIEIKVTKQVQERERS